MKVKINRKHFIEVKNIEKIISKDNICWIYKKEGYPPILKSDCTFVAFLLRLINAGVPTKHIQRLKGKSDELDYER